MSERECVEIRVFNGTQHTTGGLIAISSQNQLLGDAE